ncbi:MAG: MOSC domain-containing protein [Glaciecola sp.]
MQISHLFAGKPQPFGSRGAPSSIIKTPFSALNVRFTGALEDEQGNKKLHGGPYMAIHQYAQASYPLLNQYFSSPKTVIGIGSIGENLSAPNMDEDTVFIGDQYQIGEVILEVASPRAPCSKINYRYGVNKMDVFVAQHGITGWYFSVRQEGKMHVNDTIRLIHRENMPVSVKQIWQIRQMIKQLPDKDSIEQWLALADTAINTPALAPEWQAYVNRAASKLAKQ